MSKKFITGLLATCAVAVFLLSGCGGGSSATDADTSKETKDVETGEETKGVDINSLAESLVNDITYDGTLAKEDADIDGVGNVDYVFYTSGYMNGEEVFVCQAPDESAAAEMKKNVESFLSDQLESLEDYEPEAAARVKNAVVVSKGNYVVLCVSNDSDKAKEIINNALK